MARAKKSEVTLTLEEKLEQALVADWEQPYKVPENWCWVRLSSLLLEIKNGTTIKQDKSGNGYSVTRIESLQNQTIDFNRLGTIIDETKIKNTDWYEENDIVLSHINSAEHVGKTALITSNMLPLVHGMNLLRLRFCSLCNPKLFQYYTQSFLYKEKITSRMNMAVNQVSINQKQLGDLEYPLPPLAEQQRIVDHIERMFSKLDEVKENVQKVIDNFENRKSAILHKAFNGELTAKWRKEKAENYYEWKDIILGDYADSQYGYTESASSDQIGPRFLRITDIQNGQVDWSTVPYCQIDAKSKKKYLLKLGDIVVARTGATTGKSYLIADEVDAIYASYLIRMNIKSTELLPAYLYTFMQSQGYWKQISEFSSGIAQPGVNGKKLQKLKLPLPSIDEQKEIVCIVDELFEKEQQAKEKAEDVLERIKLIKKSILARAFRGELGTNNPEEASSLELLKSVLSEDKDEKCDAKPKSKRVSIPTEVKAMLSNYLEKDILKLFYKAAPDEVSIDDIMSVSSNKFEIMDALKALKKKKLISKKANGIYKLER